MRDLGPVGEDRIGWSWGASAVGEDSTGIDWSSWKPWAWIVGGIFMLRVLHDTPRTLRHMRMGEALDQHWQAQRRRRRRR